MIKENKSPNFVADDKTTPGVYQRDAYWKL